MIDLSNVVLNETSIHCSSEEECREIVSRLVSENGFTLGSSVKSKVKGIMGGDQCFVLWENKHFTWGGLPHQRVEASVLLYSSIQNLALVQHSEIGRSYLFELPNGEKLPKGARVICKTKFGDKEGVLSENSFTVTNLDQLAAVKLLSGATDISKIVGVYKYFPYKEAQY